MVTQVQVRHKGELLHWVTDMLTEPETARREDLRRWRTQFPDTVAIDQVRPRHRSTCAGVVHAIRLVPGKSLEVVIDDGSGRLNAVWPPHSRITGLELGTGLRVTGTVAQGEPLPVMRNPDWAIVVEPYS